MSKAKAVKAGLGWSAGILRRATALGPMDLADFFSRLWSVYAVSEETFSIFHEVIGHLHNGQKVGCLETCKVKPRKSTNIPYCTVCLLIMQTLPSFVIFLSNVQISGYLYFNCVCKAVVSIGGIGVRFESKKAKSINKQAVIETHLAAALDR